MHLLFVIDCLIAGGAQRQLTSLAVELVRRGHSVDLFAYHDRNHFGDELRAGGIRIMLHPKRRRYSFSPAWELRTLLREGGYDAVMSYLPVPNFYCLVAAAGLKRRPRVVVSERSFPLGGMQGFKNRILERFYPTADQITTNSHHMRAHYRARYGWGDDRVTTIWNGLDLDRFAAKPLARRPGEPLRLLCIGRVDRNKAWRLIAEAAGILAARDGIRFQVSIVGRNDPVLADEFVYRDELQATLRRHNLDADWQFLGERSDIAELLAAHHALVHPSIVEGLSNVVCESLACGRPVVAADAFDHRLLIQHGETGRLFEQNNVESLADALRRLNAMSSDELASMGANARRFAEQHLTVSRLADEYEALFERLVGGSPNDRRPGDQDSDSPRCDHVPVVDRVSDG